MFAYERDANYCGPGPWRRVAYVNMSDPSHQCPPVWREYYANGVRAYLLIYTLSSNYSVKYPTGHILTQTQTPPNIIITVNQEIPVVSLCTQTHLHTQKTNFNLGWSEL